MIPQQTADERRPGLEAVEGDYIVTVLRQTGWVIAGPRGAARLLGLPPSTLRNWMKRLGLTRSSRHHR
jgi:transcriptional regulator with GAF, ATPase, and Fis domain